VQQRQLAEQLLLVVLAVGVVDRSRLVERVEHHDDGRRDGMPGG
jgi:hypothetical protein